MTELSTAPTTGPANSTSDGNASPQDAGQTPAAPAMSSASTVLELLEVAGWKSLHHLATTDKNSVVIDHLAVGPGGVFVIDAHSWTPDLSSTPGSEQQAAINAASALANQIRSLLPPLTRQYVVPLLTYVDASPMSMVRGSLHVCTTSMLQGVITSRRPVLNAAEIEEVLTSLSSGLRSSPGAANATTPPSATPTRRGFLRKNARPVTSSEPSALPTTEAPRSDPALRQVAPPAGLVEPLPAFEPEIPAAHVDPVLEVEESAAEPVLPAEPAYQEEPIGATTLAEPAWLSEAVTPVEPVAIGTEQIEIASVLLSATLADPEQFTVTADQGVEPVAAAAEDIDPTPDPLPTPMPTEMLHLDEPEIEDLAHPVVPTDTRWDLEEEPALASTLTPTDDALPSIEEEPALASTLTPTDDALPSIEEEPAETVQPTLAAAALAPAVSASPPATTTPATPRKPGGRRKAAVPKTGLSRLLPTRSARPSGRSPRRAASDDGDTAQEPDLADLIEDVELTDDPAHEQWDAYEPADEIEQYQFEDDDMTAAYEIVAVPRQQNRTTDTAEPTAPLDEPKESRRAKLRRKKKSRVETEADDIDLSQMPTNLSTRGRQMYMEMQRQPKPEPVDYDPTRPAKPGKAGAVRKLFVFCVIGGAIGISSSHYEEINTWVSTHVEELPGLQKIEGPPQPETPIESKAKQVKKKQGKAGKAEKGKQ